MAEGEVGQEFSGLAFRRGRAVRFGLVIAVLLLLFASMASSVVNGIVVVYMAMVVGLIGFFAIGFVRSFRTGIWLTDEGVEVHTTYSTKTWPWDSIEHARAQDREVRRSPYLAGAQKLVRQDVRSRVLVILDLTNGRDARLYGLQMVTSSFEASSWIDQAVMAINRTLALRRGGPDPSITRPR